MNTRIKQRGVLAVAALLTLAACDATGPEGTGEARVTLSSAPAVAGAVVAHAVVAQAVESGALVGNVSLEDVASIDVTISGCQAVLRNQDPSDAAWVDLELAAGATNPIDLLSLPASGLVIARADLPAGSYGFLRIFFESATITLVNDVTVGQVTYRAADSPHELIIPSGLQTGIKIPTASFEVLEESAEDVTIEFEPALSVRTITATPHSLMMSPVLHERGGGPAS